MNPDLSDPASLREAALVGGRWIAAEGAGIAVANATEFGLAPQVYTRIRRVSEVLDDGMVGVSAGRISTARAPFGGAKSSGPFREGSRHGLDDFHEIKYICMGGIDPAREA